jgi:hypothetical protein
MRKVRSIRRGKSGVFEVNVEVWVRRRTREKEWVGAGQGSGGLADCGARPGPEAHRRPQASKEDRRIDRMGPSLWQESIGKVIPGRVVAAPQGGRKRSPGGPILSTLPHAKQRVWVGAASPHPWRGGDLCLAPLGKGLILELATLGLQQGPGPQAPEKNPPLPSPLTPSKRPVSNDRGDLVARRNPFAARSASAPDAPS